MLKIPFAYKAETKTCYRFETGERPEQMTLYLKKSKLDTEGINPQRGIIVTIEGGEDHV